MTRLLPTAVSFLVLSVSCVALAQGPSRSDGREGRSDFLSRLDTNGNGSIEPSEVDSRMRPWIDRAARYAGLDPSQPLPLDKLRAGRSGGTASGSSSGGNSSTGSRGPSAGGQSSEPLVPGFGVPAEQAQAFSFGVQNTSSTAATSGSSSAQRSEDRSRRDGRSDRDDRDRSDRDRRRDDDDDDDRSERYRRFAESIIRQNDANKNGRLEREEWKGMREPEAADANKDGVITQDELVARLTSYSRGSWGGDGRSRGGDDRSGSRGNNPGSEGASPRRFLRPDERLPKDIPSWFASADRDDDGQVMMHEYSPTWNETKAAEFAKFDLNGDGVITPKEAIEAEAERKKSSSGDRGRR